MAEMARATSLLPLSFPNTIVGCVVDVVVVAVVGGLTVDVIIGVVPIHVVAVVAIGTIVTRLASTFEVVDLFIRDGKWMRYPFLPTSRVRGTIVASPCFRGIRSCFARTVMVILNVDSYHLGDLTIPYRSPVYTFSRYSSDSSIGLDTLCRTQSSSVVRLFAPDVDR